MVFTKFYRPYVCLIENMCKTVNTEACHILNYFEGADKQFGKICLLFCPAESFVKELLLRRHLVKLSNVITLVIIM